MLAFLALGASKSVGRQALAATAQVGEGSVRTMLKKFRRAGLVGVDSAGIRLTQKGVRLYETVGKKLTPPVILHGSTLTVGRSQAGVVVRSAGGAISNGIKQRDASVRSGAEGANSYVFRAGKFTVPNGSSDCEKDFPTGTWAELREELDPREGDAIIVCGAGDETGAKLGAVAAALSIL